MINRETGKLQLNNIAHCKYSYVIGVSYLSFAAYAVRSLYKLTK